MRRLLLVIPLLFFVYAVKSQVLNPDSLLNIIATSKDVQTRVETARHYTWHYAFKGPDSATYCASRLLKIGQGRKYDDITAMGKQFMAYSAALANETYKALSFNIEALKMAEKVQNNFLFAFVYNGYGNIYITFNAEKSIEYYKKALRSLDGSSSAASHLMKLSALTNVGTRFIAQKAYDSAFVYLKKAEEIIVLLHDASQSSGNLYHSLGSLYLGLNQPKLAYAYYKSALENALRLNEDGNRRYAYVGLAKYYIAIGELDSALHCLNTAHEGLDLSKARYWVIESAVMLYEIYKAKGNDKEALRNLEISRTVQLKSDSAAQLQQVEALSFEEDRRQMEVAAEKSKLAEERKHNLQYVAIAVGIITLLILFFTLSRSIIVKEKFIEFFGVLALLAVFEFINLFIHPYLAYATNDSPVLMLLILIGIGALLVPLHHRLEKWITKRMVEKNKKIRLAAAKKTIQQLEG